MDDDTEAGDGLITCWCGVRGAFKDLFDMSDAANGCGGSGVINCECGGDFCVCHNHGEYECPGCDECDRGDDEFGEGSWLDDIYDDEHTDN